MQRAAETRLVQASRQQHLVDLLQFAERELCREEPEGNRLMIHPQTKRLLRRLHHLALPGGETGHTVGVEPDGRSSG